MYHFHVADWWAWSPRRPLRSDWLKWAQSEIRSAGTHQPEADNYISIPPMLRRRLSGLARSAIEGASNLEAIRDAVFVVCSRHGDFQRTLRLLTAVVTNAELSPTDFSLSVHNAWAGMLSVIVENTRGHSALAAGEDTFAFGLLEALTILKMEPMRPVLLLFADEPLPEIYEELAGPSEEAMGVGVILRSGADKAASRFSAEIISANGSDVGSVSQAEAFLKCIISGNETTTSGRRISWRLRADAAAN